MNGIVLIDKHSNITTRGIDNLLQRKFKQKKVGHLGTLDPLATGLLVIGLGEGTKILPFLEDLTKEYVATFKLGLLTTTLDNEGTVLFDENVEQLTREQLLMTLKEFEGKIKQIPPLTSAIKVKGVPLYKYAHRNEDFKDIPEREVEIFSLELVSYVHPFFEIRAVVGKGTYIRTLGNDIAKKFNTFASTVSLRRTRIGEFDVNNAQQVDEISSSNITSVSHLRLPLPRIDLSTGQFLDVSVGKVLLLTENAQNISLYFKDDLVAIYELKAPGVYACKRGFNEWKNNI